MVIIKCMILRDLLQETEVGYVKCWTCGKQLFNNGKVHTCPRCQSTVYPDLQMNTVLKIKESQEQVKFIRYVNIVYRKQLIIESCTGQQKVCDIEDVEL